MTSDDTGAVVPLDANGRRSSSALGRTVVAAALRTVDPDGARDAEQEKDWRGGYLGHFRHLVQAGLTSPQAGRTIAADGLLALHRQMQYRRPDGDETPLDAMRFDAPGPALSTVQIRGTATPEAGLRLPLGDEQLAGDALARRLDSWVANGIMEPSAADQVRSVLAHPEWLRLEGHTVVVLGAGAEMGPLPALLRWGARVAAIDLPQPELWQRVLTTARDGAGTLVLPVAADSPDPGPDEVAGRTGLDLMSEVGAAAEWLSALDGRLVLGNYVYADGVRNLRLCSAVDALTVRVQGARPDVALAFLATPTDVFAVPADAVEHAQRAYAQRSPVGKILGGPLRTVSAGRLLQRQYRAGEQPGVHDALVRQQGPNYALAKRIQRWRATVARDAGTPVSLHVAPPTRTRSVLKNRALAAAYAGAHRFAVEVFEPQTASTLMAALLVADLHTPSGPQHDDPWADEAFGAVHGGLWRGPYQPRSALGVAAVLGYRASGR